MIVIALSDLHGYLKTLSRLRSVQEKYPDAITVFVGDYVDCYGANSGLALLEALHTMQRADPAHTVVLMGNHDFSMVNFMKDPAQTAWLDCGGLDTLAGEAERLGLSPEAGGKPALKRLALQMRLWLLDRKADLLEWAASLPLTYVIDKLVLVHAGLDQTIENPIRDTSAHDRLWMRAAYWYDRNNWRVFDHNKFRHTIITGHTPTHVITGRYAGIDCPDKLYDPQAVKSPIYGIQYLGELPRYLIDGGVGARGEERLLGNFGVFDSQSGLLIDAVED